MLTSTARACALAITLGLAALLIDSASNAAENEPPLLGAFKHNFTLLEPPLPTPETPVHSLDGKIVSLGDYRGQVVLLNFWATWCAPCIREMPGLDRVQAELGTQKFRVVAVSQDRGGAELVGRFLQELGITEMTVLLDSKGALGSEMRLRGLPTTFLLDSKGQVIGGLEGPAEWDSPEAKALIQHYIKDAKHWSDGIVETSN